MNCPIKAITATGIKVELLGIRDQRSKVQTPNHDLGTVNATLFDGLRRVDALSLGAFRRVNASAFAGFRGINATLAAYRTGISSFLKQIEIRMKEMYNCFLITLFSKYMVLVKHHLSR